MTTTIAIPVYNGARFLDQSIESALSQTMPPSEILVFDNASTDASRQVAQSLLGEAAVRGTATNRGAAWNFSRAVAESSGEYFAWLAADDRFDPRFLADASAALDAAPSIAACLTGIQFIDVAGEPAGVQRDPDLASGEARERFRSFLRRPRWTESYCLYRREVLLSSPMFGGEFGADVVLTWWFLLRGPLLYVDAPLLQYRVYPTKTDEEMAQSLLPGAPLLEWRKARLWHALWRETRSPELTSATRRAARVELLLALLGRHWLEHNIADVVSALRRRRARGRGGQ